jgi:hypothetical protein
MTGLQRVPEKARAAGGDGCVAGPFGSRRRPAKMRDVVG